MIPSTFVNLDIEMTNRCNASCYFCPRDQTPHQGLMSGEVFEQTLARAIEFRSVASDTLERELRISLCGLGEPLLNPRTIASVARVREEGFSCSMATNATLLSEAKGRALLDAGLQVININVGEEGADYDDIYKLPFERTLENVVRFAEMAGDDCRVEIVLVDHRRDPAHLDHMMEFWRSHGLEEFLAFPIMNRGGALFVDHMQFEVLPQRRTAVELLGTGSTPALCWAPFIFLFVGYDGQYYLCCSDWKKEAPLGSVFDETFESIVASKLEITLNRRPVCETCNIDPLNRMINELRAIDEGEPDTRNPVHLAAEIAYDTGVVIDMVERMHPGMAERVIAARPAERRHIPVRSL
jgi:MoaA/NifB/PqqE/SkfB family radical SAM enzyme